MIYTKVDHLKKRLCQAGVLLGIIGIPFTGGSSLIGAVGIAMISEKYNSFLQSKEQRVYEKTYYLKEEIMENYQKYKEEEFSVLKYYKSLEDKVKGGKIVVQ